MGVVDHLEHNQMIPILQMPLGLDTSKLAFIPKKD